MSLEPGKTVFRMGNRVRMMYPLMEGQVDLVRHARSGTALILNRASPGEVLAEASAYSKAYHCDGMAIFLVTAKNASGFCEKLHGSPDAAQTWAAQLTCGL